MPLFSCDDYVEGGDRSNSTCPLLGLPAWEEYERFQNEAQRLMSSYDFGSSCYMLGHNISSGLDDIYMNPSQWYGYNPETQSNDLAFGDYHSGSGQVHLARGYMDNTGQVTQRSEQDVLTTLRHEFAHSMGYFQESQARQLADACSGGGGGGFHPDDPYQQ